MQAHPRPLDRAGSLRLAEGERWYAAYTQPHRERRAEMQLASQGYQTFLPRYAKAVRHARKTSTVSTPFFPRYLFVALDLGRDRWRSVNGTFGVSNLVMAGELPVAIPPGLIEGLAAACTADGHLCLWDTLGLGDRVRLLSGPFADLVGELTRIDGGERVTVLLRLLGGAVPVSVSRTLLMPARAA